MLMTITVRCPSPVAYVSARELHQHVARKQQAAYQSAHRERVLDPLQKGDLVVDHVGHHRSGDGAVYPARHPSQRETDPQRPVPRIRRRLYLFARLHPTLLSLLAVPVACALSPWTTP